MTILLTAALPEFVAELSRLLRQNGYPELADQVPTLQILSRCHCGDNFCGTMYTAAEPIGRWLGDHDNVDVGAKTGMIILDIVDGKIVCVEALYRPEIRKCLLELFPNNPAA